LVYFRQRLIEHGKAEVAMRAVLAALQKEGLIPKGSKQRLDSTHVLGAVARLSALECVREMPANKSGAIAPRLSNNDPCTSNCGKLILAAPELTRSHLVLPIITFQNNGFSAESSLRNLPFLTGLFNV
jgi:hypothetical protein